MAFIDDVLDGLDLIIAQSPDLIPGFDPFATGSELLRSLTGGGAPSATTRVPTAVRALGANVPALPPRGGGGGMLLEPQLFSRTRQCVDGFGNQSTSTRMMKQVITVNPSTGNVETYVRAPLPKYKCTLTGRTRRRRSCP